MTNITVSEKFAMFLIKEDTDFKDNVLNSFLISLMIAEMELEGCISIIDNSEGKRKISPSKYEIALNGTEPSREYGRLIYQVMQDNRKEKLLLGEIVDKLCIGGIRNSAADSRSIIDAIKADMVAEGLISLETKGKLFGKKEDVVLNEECFKEVLYGLREKLIGQEPLDEESMLLCSALKCSELFKKLFIKYEKPAQKQREKEIKESAVYRRISVAQLIDDSDAAAIISCL